MAEIDWEKRARELLFKEIAFQHEPMAGRMIASALQLGREMADARAEEIEKYCVMRASAYKEYKGQGGYMQGWRDGIDRGTRLGCTYAAEFARSTIEKPEGLPMCIPDFSASGIAAKRASDEAAIRADEREKIADMIQGAARGHSTPHWLEACDHFARLLRKPKTRESVLEEALRELADLGRSHDKFCECGWCDARRALEWKPL